MESFLLYSSEGESRYFLQQRRGRYVHFLPTAEENEPKERRLRRKEVYAAKGCAFLLRSDILSSLRILLSKFFAHFKISFIPTNIRKSKNMGAARTTDKLSFKFQNSCRREIRPRHCKVSER
jgi:hypothetical protein